MSYPEHGKLEKVKDQSQLIGEFLEWMENEERTTLYLYDDEENLVPAMFKGKEILLAKFFDIDLNKLEAEKRAMLDEIRSQRKAEKEATPEPNLKKALEAIGGDQNGD